MIFFFFFFFSSRRRHTRFDCDWSSDVCSSDLKTSFSGAVQARGGLNSSGAGTVYLKQASDANGELIVDNGGLNRSEEHTSELQSQSNLVCRLLLEKKKSTTPLYARRRYLGVIT